MLAGVLNLLQIGREAVQALFLSLLLEHLRVAQNGVHRGAKLMAHVGEELRLRAAGGLGIFFRAAQVFLRLLSLRDVGESDDRALKSAVL